MTNITDFGVARELGVICVELDPLLKDPQEDPHEDPQAEDGIFDVFDGIMSNNEESFRFAFIQPCTMLCEHKLYLDSYATYHLAFVK